LFYIECELKIGAVTKILNKKAARQRRAAGRGTRNKERII
jgi:hypothetical protein